MNKIEIAIFQLENIKKQEEELKIKKENASNKIIELMKKEGLSNYKFAIEEEHLSSSKKVQYDVKVISPVSILFDTEKIEKRIDSDICKKFINKEYEISDFEGLVSYLKTFGVNPKKFKTFLNVKKNVDNKKLDNLSKLGEISEEDLKGCYTVKENKVYIKSTRKELEE